MKKKRTNAGTDVCQLLPRDDLSDDAIAASVLECSGFPSKVADALGISVPDLLERAKASKKIAGAFLEARQRTVDLMKAAALKVAIGDQKKMIPPDPTMIRWFISRYE